MTQVHSFDVFDTVLTRAVGAPTSLFLLLGRWAAQEGLLVSCSAEVFARARIEAEIRARTHTKKEISLAKIYRELNVTLRLPQHELSRLMQMECDLETHLIRPNPAMRSELEYARQSSEQVIFLSDMYLPGSFIEDLLRTHGMFREGDRCYVSSEHGHGKSNGLFRAMAEREGVRLDQLVHVGNNKKHDVEAAHHLGAKTRWYEEGNLQRLERVLESYAYETEGLSSLMAGASRLARIMTPVNSPREASIRDVAASVVGPTLTSYVIWVLRRASELELKRLYFVSRDGQILLDIARRLSPKLGTTCELRYLYGGRHAWNLPATKKVTEQTMIWALSRGNHVSVDLALRRLGLVPTQVEAELRQLDFDRSQWHRGLTEAECERLGSGLVGNPRVCGLIEEGARKKRETLIEYLKQEGGFEQQPMAIVDVGWVGRALQALVTAADIDAVGFYIGLDERPSPTNGRKLRQECYLYDRTGAQGYILGIPELPSLIESFCQADHGLVLGYRNEHGRVVPELKVDGNQAVKEWGLQVVQETVRNFVGQLVLKHAWTNIWADTRPAIVDLLKHFSRSPSPTEASGWGSFPSEDDQLGSYFRPLARPYGWRKVCEALLTGRVGRRYPWEWRAGSFSISSRFIRMSTTLALRTHHPGPATRNSQRHDCPGAGEAEDTTGINP
ncbi:MAG: hypothetical protein COV75_04005 [Candidatus Omnitrophica bacterium CG11_big_fil_rev_8_21_14_0_20_63_9]|nr:MAG: hypothetical protein COV75_04005 [Candidatus Omnitrophica bacterium CG11_big_fil_rev_8_21_14_0_20_63_9]